MRSARSELTCIKGERQAECYTSRQPWDSRRNLARSMKTTIGDHQPGLLLILALDGVSDDDCACIAESAACLGDIDDRRRVVGLRPGIEHTPSLRLLVQLCGKAGGNTWLAALRPAPDGNGEPYRPMVDLSQHHASAIEAWYERGAPLPLLQPGDLIRLG